MLEHAIEKAIEFIRLKSQGEESLVNFGITINFHPDRYNSENYSVLQSIAKDGLLKSQFETGTSNGGLTAYKGGDRWLWEKNTFNGSYDKAPNTLRPKYGALNFRNYEMGASPRFGSSYFKLKPHIFQRTTFCYPDSFYRPKDFAVHTRLKHLIHVANSSEVDLLDDYIEAHIHGAISVKEDIESVVLDPVYRSTTVEEDALKLGIPISWHRGYELSIKEIKKYPDYRGQRFIELAKDIAIKERIDAKILGLAITDKGYEEQDIKKLWHYLARYGYKL